MGMSALAVSPLMPDFARGSAGFAHTVDSAVSVLESLGISPSRLTLRMAGAGRAPLEVVRQSPQPGAALGAAARVTLWISGTGLFEALPMPMRESGGELEMGTRELAQLFDDPLQKASQWLRAGSPFFQVAPGNLGACRRWLALFGIDTATWPDRLLYPLALVAPSLAQLAGQQAGIQLAFQVLFGLPVLRCEFRRGWRRLRRPLQSRLGTKAFRLGHDLLLGDRQLDADRLVVHLGPVSLDRYREFQTQQGQQLLQKTTDLVMSAYQPFALVWHVEDERQAPRLGNSVRNSRLGLNFHLGKGVNA